MIRRIPPLPLRLLAAAGILLLSAAAPAAAHRGSPAAKDSDGIRPPEAVIREVETCAADTGGWVVRERGPWLRFLLGGGASCAAGGAFLWLWFRAARRKRHRAAVSWKHEMMLAAVPPAVIFATFVACFFFFQPLAESLPRRLGEFDMRLFYTAVVLCAAWGAIAAVSVIDRRLRRFARRSDNSLDDLSVGMIGAGLRIAVVVTTLFFVGQSIFDLNISALLAGAGVIGLAVALAARETLSNVFGSLVILADSPFRLGDRIRVGDVDGIVLGVGMRSTRILTPDESLCTVPNSIFTGTVVRRSSRRGVLKHRLELGLVYDTPPEALARAETILHGILDDFHGPDAPEYRPHVFFSGFGDSALKLEAIFWLKTESFSEDERLTDEINSAILRRFRDAGLTFAYPTICLTSFPREKK